MFAEAHGIITLTHFKFCLEKIEPFHFLPNHSECLKICLLLPRVLELF